MGKGNAGVAGRAGRRAGTPRFARRSRPPLLGALEAVAAELSGPLSVEHAAAVVADAASAALDARVVVIAVLDEARRLRAVHVEGLARSALPTILAQAAAVGDRGGPQPLPATAPALVALPIPSSGRRLGVLIVGRASALTADERAYATVLSALLGLALERLRLLRRRSAGPHVFVGDMEIDLGEQRVVAGGREARLTPSEIRLLLFLAEEPGRTRSRREILARLWHSDYVGDERACDAHISNLRRKIERDPSRPERVVTVRSMGYALRSHVKVRSHSR